MDFIVIIIYVVVFAVGVYFDVKKKSKKNETITEPKVDNRSQTKQEREKRSTKQTLSEERAQQEKIRKELEDLTRKVASAKHASEQLLKEKMKNREGSSLGSAFKMNDGKVDSKSNLNTANESYAYEDLLNLNSQDELKKAFLYSEILNRRYN